MGRARAGPVVAALISLLALTAAGLPPPEDFEHSRDWYLGRAQAGDPEAQYLLALAYERRGGAEAFERALSWYERAAEASYADALYRLGLLYHRGELVAADPGRAAGLYERAASDGHRAAAFNRGVLAEEVEGDAMAAAGWYERAALLGEPRAAYNLGLLHVGDEESLYDPVEALAWLSVAAAEGVDDAAAAAAALEAVLSPDVAEAARVRSAEIEARIRRD
jgi:uncharacterized protein